MGFVISLIRGKLKNIELRIIPRDLVEFILFPNVEVSYRMNLKQDYVQGVEKLDTNAWEVDLINDKTRQLAQKIKEKISQTHKKEKKQIPQEENLQAEMEQKQLRKILSKISGLKNKLLQRQKDIDIQKKEMQGLKLKKDKIQLQVDIMNQMIREEEEKYHAYRNFDFTYVTKTYKLVDVKQQAKKKFTSSSQAHKLSQLSLSMSRPQSSNNNPQLSQIKAESIRQRDNSKYFSQYVSEDATPSRRNHYKGKAQTPISQQNKNKELIL
ncbi:hypothetical protein TTHERM_00474810 (macronuclear) [Tetrahymena thermophila SB210]|uniref:Uncharacterized protein n=1 Tax=Tetrahymena thermophila (strain SB210) TaxID=312017 RepID=I7MM02_TETTS|nr:hypothetical protein TTHERM_00474810 [Tetrahymena thermophila SB210]EAS03718.2 hypothetical protein TTHERM_00474810 [Tetrahymena thermophila SB210]|eukprot:XP_001023963.2 hypothetical protein TTHERM_00474810 [Tetrahymena thermophila SB210]